MNQLKKEWFRKFQLQCEKWDEEAEYKRLKQIRKMKEEDERKIIKEQLFVERKLLNKAW